MSPQLQPQDVYIPSDSLTNKLKDRGVTQFFAYEGFQTSKPGFVRAVIESLKQQVRWGCARRRAILGRAPRVMCLQTG